MCQPGGGDDFVGVVRQYADDIFRYALHLTGDYSRAEDLAQEVFLRAYKKWGQLRSRKRVWPWLCTICRRLFLNQNRGKVRERPHSPEEMDTSFEDKRGSAEAEAVLGEEAEGLHRAMASLPLRDRVLLMMFYYEELSYQEIARRLRMPIGTVMSALHRAKRRLRQELGKREKPSIDVSVSLKSLPNQRT